MDLFSLITNVHLTLSTFYCLNIGLFGLRSKDKSFLASSLRFSFSRGYTDEAKNSSLYPTNHLPSSSDLSSSFEVGSQTHDRPSIPNPHVHSGSPPPATGRSKSHVSLVFQSCHFRCCSRILARFLETLQSGRAKPTGGVPAVAAEPASWWCSGTLSYCLLGYPISDTKAGSVSQKPQDFK